MPDGRKTGITMARIMAGGLHSHVTDTVFRHEPVVVGIGGIDRHRGHQANTNDQQVMNYVFFHSHFRCSMPILKAGINQTIQI